MEGRRGTGGHRGGGNEGCNGWVEERTKSLLEVVHITQAATALDLQRGREEEEEREHSHSAQTHAGMQRHARWSVPDLKVVRCSSLAQQTFLKTTQEVGRRWACPARLTREDEFLLHDVQVPAGPRHGGAQHDLLGVVASHAAHPVPAGGGGGHIARSESFLRQ